MFDFDRFIDRKDTFSAKWDRFGDDVLPLWVADMDFASPPEITESMRERLKHPIFGYESAHPEVLESICNWLAERHHWQVEPDDILLMTGVVSGFNWVIRTLVEKTESVVFQTPVYHPFYRIGNNNEVKQKTIPLQFLDGRYTMEIDALEESVQDNAQMFLLCNPHNPVGRVFSKKELERLGEFCLSNGMLICSDEIHCDLVYPEEKHIPIASLSPEFAQSTITLMAPSKTFNIPGLQFAYAIVKNKDIRKKLDAGRRGIIERPNILSYYAADAAYKYGHKWLEELLQYLDGNRKFIKDFIQQEIPQIKYKMPEGTYLAWLDCSDLNLDSSPFQFFLENAKVALNDGKMFQGNGESFVRLNFACPRKTLSEALEKMAAAVRNR